MSQAPINKEALAHYRKVRDFNKKYNALDESTHSEHYDDDASWISSPTTRSTGSMDDLDSPPLSPIRSRVRSPKRTSKYHGEHNMKTLKEKNPQSMDRSLRNQDWLGSPVSVGKSRRSWKPKNSEDISFLSMKNSLHGSVDEDMEL